MKLADMIFPTETVTLSDGKTLTVRGITTDDIAIMMRTRSKELAQMFNKFSGTAEQLKGQEAAIGMTLLEAAPGLMGEIIALAMDEPTMAHVASKLPLSVQLDALEKIAVLTFEAEGGVGKFMEALVRLVTGTTDIMKSLSPSPNGGLALGGK